MCIRDRVEWVARNIELPNELTDAHTGAEFDLDDFGSAIRDRPACDVDEFARDTAMAHVRNELDLACVVPEHLQIEPQVLVIERKGPQVQRLFGLDVKLFDVRD